MNEEESLVNEKVNAQVNDKQALLDAGNYEVYPRDVIRKVFPRIIAEVKSEKPKSKIGDIIPLYFVLMTYIDGQEYRKDGSLNKRYGACFLSQDEISRLSGINKKRHPILAEVLRRNGVLLDVVETWEGTNRRIYYYPSFCPRVSEDGYVIDENGEKVVAEYGDLWARI